MRRYSPAAAFLSLLCAVFLSTLPVRAEFFKFTGKDGVTRYVDDISKIPPEYLDSSQNYQEQYDHLSEQERSIRLEQEEREAERPKEEQIVREPERTPMPEADPKMIEPLPLPPSAAAETEIMIQGNHILVPVVLAYGGHEIKAVLLLDTGATIVSLHHQLADKLRIVPFKTVTAQVADGQTVPYSLAELDSITVGPHKIEKLMVGIYEQSGLPVAHDGLLGMNFLKNLEYAIDFNRKVIKWKF